MAERRMFSSKIVCSDAFVGMPFSAQSLYFQLNMEADDDGFLNRAKRIQGSIGASDEDLNLLLEKRFILGFPNGVVVVKHWRMNNQIRKDRYTPTQYRDEFNSLDIKDDGAYTEKVKEEAVDNLATIRQPSGNQMATTWQPNGNHLATQVRLGQDSIVQDSIGEGEEADSDESEAPPSNADSDKISCQQIVDLYHSICKSYPSVRAINEYRKKAIRARLNTYTLDDFRKVFEYAESSSFLKGSNERNWSANFDWLIADKNMAKVLEGNYADKPKRYGRKEPVPGWMPFTMGDAEKEAIQQLLREDEKPTIATDPELAERAEALRQQLQGGGIL